MSLDMSPTFRSGDYFAPMAKPKRLATKSQPVKRLYQVTSLRKSACRPSDQLIPDVTKVNLISVAKEANLITSKAERHDCSQPIFEVFPKFDANQHKQNMEELTSKQRILGAKNIAGLEDLMKKYYHVTSHRQEYETKSIPKNEIPPKPAKTKPSRPISGRKDMYNDAITYTQSSDTHPKCALCNCHIYIVDSCDGTTENPVCNYCKSTSIFRLDFYENPFRKSEEKKHVITPLNVSELRQLTRSKVCKGDKTTRTPETYEESTLMKRLKARIEKTDVYTSPLNYLGYYSGRHRNRLPSLIRKLPNSATTFKGVEDVATKPRVQQPKRVAVKRVAVPVSLKDKDYLKGKGICCSENFLSKEKQQRKASLSGLLPMMHFPVQWEETVAAENDTKVFENITKKSSSSPEKVKEFQSLAHKKFHEDFPETIPDLRESRKDSKTYFFHGYHTSVFRG